MDLDDSHKNLIEDDMDVNEEICLEHNQIYIFIITDSFGDGICCSEGNGSYSITLNDNILANGGVFTDSEEQIFSLQGCLSNADCLTLDACTTSICHSDTSTCIYTKNDCDVCGAMVTVSISTGGVPYLAHWRIEADSERVMRGEHYSSQLTTYNHTKCIPVGSYKFSLFGYDQSCGWVGSRRESGPCSITVNDKILAIHDDMEQDVDFEICVRNTDCDDGDPSTNDICLDSLCDHSTSITTNVTDSPSFSPTSLSPTFSVILPTTKPSLNHMTPMSTSMMPSLADNHLDEWILKFEKSFVTNNKDMLNGGLTLQYQLSKNKVAEQLSPRLYDKNCKLPLNNSTVAIQKKSIIVNHTSEMDVGRVVLVFNSSNLRNSTIWRSTSSDLGTMEFCIRTKLLLKGDDISIAPTFVDTVIVSELKFDELFGSAQQSSMTKSDIS